MVTTENPFENVIHTPWHQHTNPSHAPGYRRSETGVDYTPLLDVLETTERAYLILHQLGSFPIRFAAAQSAQTAEQMNNEIGITMNLFNDTLGRIGGMPVRLATQEGTVIDGQITAAKNFNDGKWTMLVRTDTSEQPMSVPLTTDEIRSSNAPTDTRFPE